MSASHEADKKNDMCIHERSSAIEHLKLRILQYTMNSPIPNHNHREFDDGSETGGERLGKGEVVASECGCALHLQPQRGCVGESREHEF